ncbi:2Fe-2S iron-sulfur cluster-binding protein [Halobacteriovorax sp. HLS]|uniref:2Fe-2S iron-sulfur cluster-binding protein n=1 Tax=Halobacteriovorax sp. HLS TaxID=2234000 RepID=UPI000FD8E58D|nr:2Fe-2S iron-sulfur cluster-binding protein [Halobacteriovorax sp. HLS]
MHTVSLVELAEDGETLSENVLTFEVAEGQVLWESLELQGHELPSGCLAGSCGSCRINVIEGEENLSKLSVIEKDTIDHLNESYLETHGKDWIEGKNLRLSCRSKVFGDIKIHVLKK